MGTVQYAPAPDLWDLMGPVLSLEQKNWGGGMRDGGFVTPGSYVNWCWGQTTDSITEKSVASQLGKPFLCLNLLQLTVYSLCLNLLPTRGVNTLRSVCLPRGLLEEGGC